MSPNYKERPIIMKKTYIWIIAAVAVVALIVGYQVMQNPSGTGTPTSTTQPGTGDKADDPGAGTDHTGKPGEAPKP